jgi:hypothetical protein
LLQFIRDLGRIALVKGDTRLATQLLRECLLVSQEMKAPGFIAAGLSVLAYVFQAQEHFVPAAHLLGAVEEWTTRLGQISKAEYNRNVEMTKIALGDEAFAAAYAEGQTMTVERAVEYALAASATR